MKKNRVILALLAIFFVVSPAIAQDAEMKKKPEYIWGVNANMGYSLLWGDAGSQNPNPFARWFSEDESAFSYGLTIHRKLNETFKIQAGLIYGKLNSKRDVWSDDTHPVTTAQTTYIDAHLDVKVDFTGMFGAKPDRLVSFYGLVGLGMANYSAESQNDGVIMPDRTVDGANTFFIPWGWGLDFRINDRLNITFENTFRHTFVDDFDAYIGGGSNFNDFYSITGLGLTYNFGQKRQKKQPRIDIEPVEPVEEPVIAAKEPANVTYSSSIPAKVKPNSEYSVNSVVEKGDLDTKAKYTLTIPEDFYVSEVVTAGGKVEQDSSLLTVSWDKMPEGNLMISYKLATGGLEKESYVLDSKLVYEEEGEEKVKAFSNKVNLEIPAVAVVEEVQQPSEIVEKPVETVPVNKEVANIEYRVQIAATFGGTTSKGLLKKRLGLVEDVKEDPYKNSYRYTVGSFNTYGEAAQHGAISKVRGAYVVVFKDGKYIGGLESLNEEVMDKDGIYPTGDTYKVQIAGSKGRNYSIAKLAYKYGLEENKITEDKTGEWYQYTTGKFRNYKEAKPMLSELQKKIPGAYIIKFVDGKR